MQSNVTASTVSLVRLALEYTTDAVFGFDAGSLVIRTANPAALQWLGLPRDMVLGHRILDVIPKLTARHIGEWVRRTVGMLDRPLPGGEPGANGLEAVRVILQRFSDGPAMALFRLERARTVVEMEAPREAASGHRYRRLVRFAKDCIVEFGRDRRLLYVNASCKPIFDHSAEDFYADPGLLPSLLHSDSQPLWEMLWTEFERNGAFPESTREWTWQLADGRIRYTDTTATNLRSPLGEVVGLGLYSRDVTDRKTIENALRLSHGHLEAALRAIPVAVAGLGRSGHIQMWNHAATTLFGWDENEVVGKRLPFEFPYSSSPAAWLTASTSELEVHVVSRSGEPLVVRVAASPLMDASSEPSTIVLVLMDVTELRRAEQEQRAIEKTFQEQLRLQNLGLLSGNVAHDFNNLLSVMIGNAALAREDIAEGLPVEDSLERIESAAHRAADLCRQLVAYSGKGRFAARRIDINSLVADMSKLLEVAVAPRGGSLVVHLGEALPAVEADATQLGQVLMNLVLNAVDALHGRSGTVEVFTGTMFVEPQMLVDGFVSPGFTPGQCSYLEVRDNGCGMPPDVRSRIFDPFYTTKGNGRGLGLASTVGIVRGHRGALTVVSAPGRGSVFTLYLPAAIGAAEYTRKPVTPTSTWKGKGLALVVDNDEMTRSLAMRVLAHAGFTTLAAMDGYDALARFAEHGPRIDLVILDLRVSQLSGLEVFSALTAKRPKLPFVLTSGFEIPELPGVLNGRTRYEFLEKPYLPCGLVAAVRQVMTD